MKRTPRVLTWDIETTRAEFKVLAFDTRNEIRLRHTQIVKPAAIACISYSWAHEPGKVQTLYWDKNMNHKAMLEKFIPIVNKADVNIYHNGDGFDKKWVTAEVRRFNLPAIEWGKAYDTYKIAKANYRLQSYAMAYMLEYFGLRPKIKNPPGLWDRVEEGEKKALKEMGVYCENDVLANKDLYDYMQQDIKAVIHAGVMMGNERYSCPGCGGYEVQYKDRLVSAAGIESYRLLCRPCYKSYKVSSKVYRDYLGWREDEKMAKEQRKALK